MRVLSVIDSLGHGGAETVLVDLVFGLGEHEHRVLHFSHASRIVVHQPFVDALERRGVGVVDAHWKCLLSAASRSETLGAFRPDVVLFHWWGKHPWQPWVDAAAEVPPPRRPRFILVLHHAEIPAPSGYDRYVLVADAQRPQVAHVDTMRVSLIPNGVDLRRFAARRGPRSTSRMVVGRISSLREGKIAADWVDDVAAFAVPDTHFVIAGEGALRATLVRRAAELGVDDRVRLPGYVPREAVARTLGEFDVLCYSTSSAVECNPLALMEALAAGVPVVAEARGGIPGIVTHGINGLLAASRGELGTHLHHLRRDPDLRARLAAGARASAARFGLRRQVDAYRALLRRERGGAEVGRASWPQ